MRLRAILSYLTLFLARSGVEKGKEVSSIMEGWDFLQLISALVINSEMPSIQTKVLLFLIFVLVLGVLVLSLFFSTLPVRPNLSTVKQAVDFVKG